MHTGLSPYYRGGNTNFWPFIYREFDCFGVTIHKLSTGIDSGDIVYNRQVLTEEEDTYSSINCKAIILGTELMINAIKSIENNQIKAIKQWERGKLFNNRDFNNFYVKRYFKILENEFNGSNKDESFSKKKIQTY